MSGPNMHMPIYWGDYLKDTGHLSAAEHGAYLLLIGHYWTTGAPLQDNEEAIRRIARMLPKEWKASRETIRAFFQIDGGLWRHKRIDAEMARARKVYQKRVDAANARWGNQPTPADAHANEHAHASANAHAEHEQPQPHLLTEKNATLLGPTLPAADADGPADAKRATGLIATFDAVVAEIWGDAQRRPWPAQTDLGTALRWLADGVTPELVRGIAEPRFRRMQAENRRRPDTLKFLDEAIKDTLADAQRRGVPPPGQKADPEREAAAKRYTDAVNRWHDDGRQGPAPKPEDFGMKARAA